MPAINLSENSKEALEQILSEAGGEAVNQVAVLVEAWKKKNGLVGAVILGPNGEVYTNETTREKAEREAAELLAIQEQEAASSRKTIIITVVSIVAVVGIGIYLINKKR